MGRLTRRDKHEPVLWIKDRGFDVCYTPEDRCFQALSKLTHYEDMEEQGRLIELPCAVGDTIYEVHDGEIRTNRLVTKWRITRYLEEGFFGESVFTTKEEAEAKLKELEDVHKHETTIPR